MPTVEREVVLPVPRERAWELITEADELAGWLADDVEFEPAEDARVSVTWEDGSRREGVVEQVCELERIVFRWGDSRVEWRLDDAPDGTRFTVTERTLAPVAASGAWAPALRALSRAAALCPA